MLWTALAAVAFGRVVNQPEPFTDEEYWTLWQHFQTLDGHNGYQTVMEHDDRFEVFKKNMDFAREFNQKGEYTFTMGVTIHADKTAEEFEAWLKATSGTKPAPHSNRSLFDMSQAETAPDSKDWVTVGAVTPVKNQGQCGSCWAFSTTGGVEGQNFLVNNKLSSFSEQELVDCSQAEGNQGCNGGLMDDGFTYVEQSGLCYESAYPYEGVGGTCKASSCTSQVSVTGYTDIPQGDTAALMTASGTVGPISIAVDANTYWQLYSGGVFNHFCNPNKLDHGVLLVGYKSGEYWKVKNSWGASWGENGYIRMKGTDANTCGLANSASYPTVSAK
jgi:cathepsin L